MSNDIYNDIVTKGTYYFPAVQRYSTNNTSSSQTVTCDRCFSNNLRACIGYKEYDLCLQCADFLVKSTTTGTTTATSSLPSETTPTTASTINNNTETIPSTVPMDDNLNQDQLVEKTDYKPRKLRMRQNMFRLKAKSTTTDELEPPPYDEGIIPSSFLNTHTGPGSNRDGSTATSTTTVTDDNNSRASITLSSESDRLQRVSHSSLDGTEVLLRMRQQMFDKRKEKEQRMMQRG